MVMFSLNEDAHLGNMGFIKKNGRDGQTKRNKKGKTSECSSSIVVCPT